PWSKNSPTMFRILLAVGVLGSAFLAYRMQEPLPDYVQDKGIVTYVQSVFKILETLGRIVEALGLTTMETFRQRAFSAIVPAIKNSSRLHSVEKQFAGSRTIVAWRPESADGRAVPGSKPGIIYIHGGGWAIGAPEFNVNLISEMVERARVTVFAISYRLSIEQRFPAAFEDSLAATRAIFDSAADFNVDPQRIGLCGDSAGGQLAASVAQALRRSAPELGDDWRRPKLQLLIYPVMQAASLRTESYLTQQAEPFLKPWQMADFISIYLTGSRAASDWLLKHGHVTAELRAAYQRATGLELQPSMLNEADSQEFAADADLAARVATSATDYRVSPLLGADLEKLDLPPAFILACEFDPLLDDALLYADRLERSEVRVQLTRFSTFHAAVGFPNDGREIRDRLVEILENQL
ncbi:hypothetical protein BOX15_Mlig013450g2, partial [Macrostomum lignano]